MNKAERLKAIEIKAMAIQAEITMMEVGDKIGYTRYAQIVYLEKIAELRALAAELEQETTPRPKLFPFVEYPKERPDPLYEVGQVVLWQINGKPAPIKKIEWDESNKYWLYWLLDVHCATNDLIKPYSPTFQEDDTVQVLAVPVGTITRIAHRSFDFTSHMKKLIGTKQVIKKVHPLDQTVSLEGDINVWDSSWLLKCEPERTVERGQWWKPSGYVRPHEVEKVVSNQVFFYDLETPCPMDSCLSGKQFRVEEIK